MFITNATSDFLIYDCIKRERRKLEFIRDKIFSDLQKLFSEVKVNFISEETGDARLRYFIDENNTPLYIYNYSAAPPKGQEKVYAFYKELIYSKEQFNLKRKSLISEISTPITQCNHTTRNRLSSPAPFDLGDGLGRGGLARRRAGWGGAFNCGRAAGGQSLGLARGHQERLIVTTALPPSGWSSFQTRNTTRYSPSMSHEWLAVMVLLKTVPSPKSHSHTGAAPPTRPAKSTVQPRAALVQEAWMATLNALAPAPG